VNWAAVQPAADGTLDLSTPANATARSAILEGLEAVQPTAEVTRAER
jgi:hypothetical protein